MRHGGDTGAARAMFGEPSGGWLDLSTGINPTAYPFAPPDLASWTRLPQAAAEADLLDAARKAYGVPEVAGIVAAPGTQILIQLLARLRPRARVAIVGPTYSEHALAWGLESATVRTIEVADAARAAVDSDVIVVVNPNNPDGRIATRDELLLLARILADHGGLLVVDEAFADVAPWVSVVPDSGARGMIVLRSFGKFYGLAGVRLGFAVGAPDEVGRIAAWLGPWATSGPAIDIGRAALRDDAWIAAQRDVIREESERLAVLLAGAGLAIVGTAGLFVLAAHPQAARLHAALARRGIWVRRFDEQPMWLRFGLPGEGSQRLVLALAGAVDEVHA